MKNFLIPTIGVLALVIVFEIVFLSSIKNNEKNITTQITPTAVPSAYTNWTEKKALLKESVLTDTSVGVISEIDTKGGEMEYKGKKYPYTFFITLKNESGKKHSYIYEGNDIDKTTISSGLKKLTLSGLNQGDKVVITEVIDLVKKTDNVISIKIEKL